MKAPHTYTREDVVEINSHSGYLILSKILQVVLDQGARLAKPGEFTFRAFLNGRIDLTQAEAVVDLINSQSAKGLTLASQQIQGSLRKEIGDLRQKATDLLAQAEVAIDFPEEEAGIFSKADARDQIDRSLIRPIEALIKTHGSRRLWVDGVKTVIAGAVNVGKSSLLNRLLDEQRAIVTPIPGTTRDIIESTVTIEGVPLRLMDTAGLRYVKDEVEKIGVHLTEQKLAESDFVLIVIDQSRPLNQNDLDILSRARGKKALIVVNKIDLASQLGGADQTHAFAGFDVVKISALTGEGLDGLRRAIRDCVTEGNGETAVTRAATNIRHKKSLEAAAQSFHRANQHIRDGAPLEIIAFELKCGLDALGEIIGQTTGEDVLDSIFSQFCLGK
jgi:tRNA modification GTPase